MNKRTHEALRKIAAGKLERGLDKFRVGAQNFFNRLYDPGVPEIPNDGYPTVADWQRYADQPRNTGSKGDDYSRRLSIANMLSGRLLSTDRGSLGAKYDKSFRNRLYDLESKGKLIKSKGKLIESKGILDVQDLETAYRAGQRERIAESLLGFD